MKNPRRTQIAALAIVAATAFLRGCGGGNAGAPAAPGVDARQACATLQGKKIAGATVTAAAVIAASAAVPTYCNVTAKVEPSLNFEMRMPDTWIGKLHYMGGGGYNGLIVPASVNALQKGFITIASDSGHQGNPLDASFALNDAYAASLFGSLSVPTVLSPALEMIKTVYGRAPSRSYFEGCSNGGREALINAQRHADLFDGIVAMAPAYNWAGVMGAFNRTARAVAHRVGSSRRPNWRRCQGRSAMRAMTRTASSTA